MLVVLMGFAALVVDIGVLRRANQELWSALDAGALAGASQLPANGANASTLGLKFAQDNYPGLPSGDVTISYRCLVGDRDDNNVPDSMDIPLVCDPGGNVAGLWVCADGACAAPCVPAEGDIVQHDRGDLAGDRAVPVRSGRRGQRGADPDRRRRRPAGDHAAPRPTCHSTSWSSSTGRAA